MQVQQRIQRTYRVALLPFSDSDAPIAVEVNLSYPLDDELPEPNHILAQTEAIDRLRRLARQGRATSSTGETITTADIEARDWNVAAIRQTLVTVQLDENGKPVRKARS